MGIRGFLFLLGLITSTYGVGVWHNSLRYPFWTHKKLPSRNACLCPSNRGTAVADLLDHGQLGLERLVVFAYRNKKNGHITGFIPARKHQMRIPDLPVEAGVIVRSYFDKVSIADVFQNSKAFVIGTDEFYHKFPGQKQIESNNKPVIFPENTDEKPPEQPPINPDSQEKDNSPIEKPITEEVDSSTDKPKDLPDISQSSSASFENIEPPNSGETDNSSNEPDQPPENNQPPQIPEKIIDNQSNGHENSEETTTDAPSESVTDVNSQGSVEETDTNPPDTGSNASTGQNEKPDKEPEASSPEPSENNSSENIKPFEANESKITDENKGENTNENIDETQNFSPPAGSSEVPQRPAKDSSNVASHETETDTTFTHVWEKDPIDHNPKKDPMKYKIFGWKKVKIPLKDSNGKIYGWTTVKVPLRPINTAEDAKFWKWVYQSSLHDGVDGGSTKQTDNAVINFEVWFKKQINSATDRKRGISLNDKDILVIKVAVESTLLANGLKLTGSGYLIDAQGRPIDLKNLNLRPMLIGSSMTYNRLINSRTGKLILQDTPFLETFLVTLKHPARILGIVPLGVTTLSRGFDKTKGLKANIHVFEVSAEKSQSPKTLLAFDDDANEDSFASATRKTFNAPAKVQHLKGVGKNVLGSLSNKNVLSAAAQLPKLPLMDLLTRWKNKHQFDFWAGRKGDGRLGGWVSLGQSDKKKSEEAPGFRIIGGNPVVGSGALIKNRGRSGYGD